MSSYPNQPPLRRDEIAVLSPEEAAVLYAELITKVRSALGKYTAIIEPYIMEPKILSFVAPEAVYGAFERAANAFHDKSVEFPTLFGHHMNGTFQWLRESIRRTVETRPQSAPEE